MKDQYGDTIPKHFVELTRVDPGECTDDELRILQRLDWYIGPEDVEIWVDASGFKDDLAFLNDFDVYDRDGIFPDGQVFRVADCLKRYTEDNFYHA